MAQDYLLAFVTEAPLVLEEIGAVTRGIITGLESTNLGAKLIPLTSPLAKLLGKKKKLAEKQKQLDGRKVIKVADAVEIVQSEVDGIMGTIGELSDLGQLILPPEALGGQQTNPGVKEVTVSGRCAVKFREKSLQQKNKRESVKLDNQNHTPVRFRIGKLHHH